MKVLIAEDEYCSRMNLIRQIKECLFHTTLEIFEAENGREAWDIFLGQHPELVLTDIRMPLLDGLELTEMISQSQLYTKVIIVSGFAEFEYAQRAMKYGAVGYLLKPIQEKELMNLLRQKEIIGEASGLEHGNEIMPITGTSVAARLKQLLTSTGEEFGREGDNILNEIFNIDLDDGVTFEFTNIKEIRQEDEYGGYRVSLNAKFDKLVVPMKLDITTGDVIVPKEVNYKFGLMFEDRSIEILAYNMETVIADKFETIISRNVDTTRARDFYDIYILWTTQQQNFDKELLGQAIVEKFKYRESTDKLNNIDEIMEVIKESDVLKEYWKNYYWLVYLGI